MLGSCPQAWHSIITSVRDLYLSLAHVFQVGLVISYSFPLPLLYVPASFCRQEKFWVKNIVGVLLSLSLHWGSEITLDFISILLGVSVKVTPINT